MEKFFGELNIKIQEAVKKDFQRINKEIGEEKIYAVALVTDSDCVTLYLAINTCEYMKKRDAQYDREEDIKSLQAYLSPEKIEEIRNRPPDTSKWITDEWGYSDGRYSELVEISKLLFEKQESLNSEEYSTYMGLFFETVTSAFKHSIQSKVFGENAEEITFFISMTDDEKTYEIENFSAELLNSKSVYEEFLKRHEGWK